MAILLGSAPLATQIGITPATAQTTELPQELLDQAREYALTLTGGQKIGGKVSILGVNGGIELEMLRAAWRPFEEATGIALDYSATTDFAAVLQTRVNAGDPPDIVGSTNINNLVRFAAMGKLKDLDTLVGGPNFEGHFDQGLIEAASYDGKIYGVWTEIHNFMVWYNTHTYDGPRGTVTQDAFDEWARLSAGQGRAPWCYTDERGASSGFVGLHWIQTYILRNFGPEVFQGLAQGTHSWDSPEVRAAFAAFGEIVHDPAMLEGGAIGAMSTPAVQLGDGLFSDPPRCLVAEWATYTGGLTLALHPDKKPIEDLDFMPVPGKPEYGSYQNFQGTIYLAFKDTPQVRAFLTYLASEQGQRLVASAGNWVVANNAIKPEDYSNPILTKVSSTLMGPDVTLLSQPSQIIDPPVAQAFRQGVVDFVMDADALDSALAAIDAARD